MRCGGETVFDAQLQQSVSLPKVWFDETGNIVCQSDKAGTYELTLADESVMSVAFAMSADSIAVKGPWQVSFQAGWAVPEKVTLESLIDLSQHDDPGVKYFSGTASYATQFEMPSYLINDEKQITLDLGDVQVIAEVFLNGKELGIVWKSPFELDVTDTIKPGHNELIVEVANLWVNRLIGDEQYPDDCEWKVYSDNFTMPQWPEWFVNNQPRPTSRVTFFPYKHHSADAKLVKSGLLGPVTLKLTKRKCLPDYPKDRNAAVIQTDTYLADIKKLLQKGFHDPGHRTINIVCHGHSVPAGYFVTPKVDTFNAYPHLLHMALKEKYPNAVINVVVTAIGGEVSTSGKMRFERDVLAKQPDVITIDYALNDRIIGLEDSKIAWESMIKKAMDNEIKVILLTPTADTTSRLDDPEDPLNKHAEMIKELAQRHDIGLVDSLAEFKNYVSNDGKLEDLMSQFNHPNRNGHKLVVQALMEWF